MNGFHWWLVGYEFDSYHPGRLRKMLGERYRKASGYTRYYYVIFWSGILVQAQLYRFELFLSPRIRVWEAREVFDKYR